MVHFFMATGQYGKLFYRRQHKKPQRSRRGDKRGLPEKLAAQLKEWDVKLDVLSANAQKATTNARVNNENELESLKTKRAARAQNA
jgi:hypothetical protein